MADVDTHFTMTGKHAFQSEIKGTIRVNVKMTKRYIWIMKMRYIWAVIRAKVGE